MVVEHRFSEGQNERYRALATELVNLKVELIVAPGTPAALAAKEATNTIPSSRWWLEIQSARG